MTNFNFGFHENSLISRWNKIAPGHLDTKFTYTFQNFFHPFAGDLIAKLNCDSLSGVLDATWLDSLKWNSLVSHTKLPRVSFDVAWEDSIRQDAAISTYSNYFRTLYSPSEDKFVQVNYLPKEIDVSEHGPAAYLNLDLLLYIPLTIAVHLTKTQRFAEAQRWFHYIFDPTSNDQSVDDPLKRFWKFLGFRKKDVSRRIEDIIRILSIPRSQLTQGDQELQDEIMVGYNAIRDKPFQPPVVAGTRPLAYQYYVLMKYLDNLISWGDYLFHQDSAESINEATQLYVLAANILGERPKRIPPRGEVKAKTFAQLKKDGVGPIGDALVDLEGQFPFNLAIPNSGAGGSAGVSSTLFGIGRTLYFCIPRNDKLLSYWDTVANRLFKIRHCMNIAGVVRPLALFDPPIDPGMLVKAAAAGIDIGSIVSGLNQPIGPVRSLFLIQKALELCGEVRGLGNALLSALEKADAAHLALIRQRHEIQIQQMAQEVRFLQWKSAQEATNSLLTSRATAIERLHYYQRLMGLPADQNVPDTIELDRSELMEENFDEAYNKLVGQYDKILTLQKLSDLKLAGETSPGILSGYSGTGKVYLTVNEDKALNTHLPAARDARLIASERNMIASTVASYPDLTINEHYWGIGVSSNVTGGQKLSSVIRLLAEISQITATWEQDQAGMTSQYASYERRADEWQLQCNLAAHELMQIGRQILTSLIAEQIARHEYLNIQQRIKDAQEVDQHLQQMFTNEEHFVWMQGEISRLHYEYYRLAFDTSRRAERTMKQELMRAELDSQDFVKFNYWDGGRKGLLSGEALYLDVKRMEMAYHDNNKREFELTKHVSLRQLNPLALLSLKATGTCQVTIPEWLFDLDCPGHYMRRIKSVALSIPSVAGPYTSVNCTLSLLKSSLRKSPIAEDYLRQGPEDDRFVDYIGVVQSIVTSTAQNDSGMHETTPREEHRPMTFEGAGLSESTWKLDLPKDYCAFDYNTISDVILHIRYTARQGVELTKVKNALDVIFQKVNYSNLALLFSLRHDFPTEWSAFVNGASEFTATIRSEYFPYFTHAKKKTIKIEAFDLYGYGKDSTIRHEVVNQDSETDTTTLNDISKQAFSVILPGPTQVLTRAADTQVFLIIRYSLSG